MKGEEIIYVNVAIKVLDVVIYTNEAELSPSRKSSKELDDDLGNLGVVEEELLSVNRSIEEVESNVIDITSWFDYLQSVCDEI